MPRPVRSAVRRLGCAARVGLRLRVQDVAEQSVPLEQAMAGQSGKDTVPPTVGQPNEGDLKVEIGRRVGPKDFQVASVNLVCDADGCSCGQDADAKVT